MHCSRREERGRGERGASLVEYAFLAALIAIACIVAIRLLGERASNNLSRSGSVIESSYARTSTTQPSSS